MESSLDCDGDISVTVAYGNFHHFCKLFFQEPNRIKKIVSVTEKRKLTNFGSIVAPTDRHSLLKSNFEVNLQTSDFY